MISSNISMKSTSLLANDNEEVRSSSVTNILKAINALPLDRESIPQENLDLANKLRTSLFPWRGQFSPELVALFLDRYASDMSVILDPFVGMGTTLFEASARDLRCYGV